MQYARDDIDKWTDVWEKAMQKGIFDTPKEEVPTPGTATHSYFGFFQSHPTDTVREPDAEYWNKVYSLSNGNDYIDPMEMLTEDNKKEIGKTADAVAKAANPIHPSSVGPDQAANIDMTYSEKDVEDLAELKVQLHALEDKLNDFEGRGQNGKKFESQIINLKKQIDDLSDQFNRSYYQDGHK